MSELLTRSESWFFVAICLLAILLNELIYFRKGRDIVWLFVFINLIALLFFFMQESTLLKEPSAIFSLSMLLAVFLFPIGYFVTFFTNGRRILKEKERLLLLSQKLSINSLFLINRVGYFFYFFAFIYELSVAGWVFPLFSENKLQAYYSFPQNFVHYLVVASIPITIIFSFLYFLNGKKNKIDVLVIGIMLVFNLLILARAVFMTQFFMLVYFWAISRGLKINIKYLTYCGISILIFITIVGYYRTGDTYRILLDIGGLNHWPDWMVPLAWPYLYFSTSIENFRNIYHTFDPDMLTYGFRTPIIYLFSILQDKESIPYWGYAETSAAGFNTFGIFLTSYYDFYIFFPIYFFILGMIVGYIKKSDSLALRLFWPYLIYCIFTSPINDYLSNFFTFVYILYLFLAVFLAKLNSKKNGSTKGIFHDN
ncbi:oligosaccharide repeat unit polymerase [Pectobacterium brasiliense]|uniref:O-antigen polymerase n=1 Tax=Pectobacterium brasiliense TaxID=180957 RepID=UPI001D0D5029|nr:O-antigen polymerase [Pectobacterium brasiliense]UDQ77213.1 oligosaccharide repeat unit polymerase [Pectobacterium brasiliense]